MDGELREKRKISSLSNELARQRNFEAAERTLLAWIRTSLSLITFGFAIYKVVQVFGTQRSHHVFTAIIGLCFILLGIYAVVAATLRHTRELKALERDDYSYRPSGLGTSVSIALACIGLMALVIILVEVFAYGLRP
ncbi:YidH family protein [Desulfoferrobacter suflitae]|uniref:YidH family protein n=1 Tax=Desulfoferrobacter suflitae TaxID=2865782 RepID=UPI002164D544|nr:DUF202 domain-containing protein [Desulfoferrobacter suflitae]MCK8602753.1 DUF202 domain-containing protein [Desulfoferrobacter suflitae]